MAETFQYDGTTYKVDDNANSPTPDNVTIDGTTYTLTDTAGTGNDILPGTSSGETLLGLAGDDILLGKSGDDVLNGGTGDDILIADAGNDTLIGGDGNDTLDGGANIDTFVFNFEVTAIHSSSVEQMTVWFRDGNSPANIADYSAWNNYDKQLDVWRAEMFALYGADANAADTYSLDIKVSGGTAKKPTTATYHFDGDASYTFDQVNVTSTYTVEGEGHDTILDWNSVNGIGNNDVLDLRGLSNDSTADNYWGNVLTTDTLIDGQTVISFDGGSITLIGVDTTIQTLIDAGQVTFG